jgi:hypothetical protein
VSARGGSPKLSIAAKGGVPQTSAFEGAARESSAGVPSRARGLSVAGGLSAPARGVGTSLTLRSAPPSAPPASRSVGLAGCGDGDGLSSCWSFVCDGPHPISMRALCFFLNGWTGSYVPRMRFAVSASVEQHNLLLAHTIDT